MGSGAKSSRPCDGKWFTTPHAETLTYRGAYGHFLRVNKTVRCPFLRGVKMPRMVKCIKLGREAEGLDFPTYPGELGKRILCIPTERDRGFRRMMTAGSDDVDR